MKQLAERRADRLMEGNTPHQVFKDTADEGSWIKEKRLLVRPDD